MDTLSELKASATEAAGKVSAAATTVLTDEAAREDLLKKLTLNTDELKAERAQMDAEENRKADVKGKLARLLPWETLDEEREILCEECKEKILSMSKEKTTFTGPFILVGQSNTEVAAKDVSEVIHVGDDEADLGEDDADNDEEGGDQDEAAADGPNDSSGGETSTQPDLSDAAVETAKMEAKKAKLDPLPPLLEEFDLDAHVGLIERLFKEDPSLVAKHADLGGAGERERSFWRNYFFHCALARYEAGLSVDEIWGDKPVETVAATSAAAIAAPDEASEHAGDETITFEPASPARQVSDVLDDDAAAATASLGASLSAPSTGGAPSISSGAAPNTGLSVSQDSSASDYSPYEMVGGGSAVGAPDGGGDTEDMDDLEAEIARELEGLEDD